MEAVLELVEAETDDNSIVVCCSATVVVEAVLRRRSSCCGSGRDKDQDGSGGKSPSRASCHSCPSSACALEAGAGASVGVGLDMVGPVLVRGEEKSLRMVTIFMVRVDKPTFSMWEHNRGGSNVYQKQALDREEA